MPDDPTPNVPAPSVAELQNRLATAARDGVQSQSVDGVSVTRQSNADVKIAVDEAKKAAVDRIPMTICRWK